MSLMQEKIHQIIRKSILFIICSRQKKSKKSALRIWSREASHLHMTLCLHCAHSFPLCLPCALEKASICLQWAFESAAVGGCGVATGKAVLHSCQECVTQQPLLWTPEEKTFGVDV